MCLRLAHCEGQLWASLLGTHDEGRLTKGATKLLPRNDHCSIWAWLTTLKAASRINLHFQPAKLKRRINRLAELRTEVTDSRDAVRPEWNTCMHWLVPRSLIVTDWLSPSVLLRVVASHSFFVWQCSVCCLTLVYCYYTSVPLQELLSS